MSKRTQVGAASESLGHSEAADHPRDGRVSGLIGQAGPQRVLTYHEILPSASQYVYRVTNAQFQEHLSMISSSAGEITHDGRLPGITFDDGHRSNYENAFPLLEQFGQKATFFVLAGRVGSTANYISWNQARQMVAAGHHVQSHGWSHRLLTQCSPRELKEELARSKRELEDRLGKEVVSVSVPGGRWNKRVVAACVRAGYKFILHSNPWVRPRISDGVRLSGRLMVTGRMDARALKTLMQITGLRRLYFRAKYDAKERVRYVLGDRVYHRLWCWLANGTPEEGMEVQVDGRKSGEGESGRA